MENERTYPIFVDGNPFLNLFACFIGVSEDGGNDEEAEACKKQVHYPGNLFRLR
jgi:hypothetical protein